MAKNEIKVIITADVLIVYLPAFAEITPSKAPAFHGVRF